MPFYFQGYRILSILLPGIWDTVFNIFITFRDIEYLGNLIMGIFANLYGILARLLPGIWDIGYPLYKPRRSWVDMFQFEQSWQRVTDKDHLCQIISKLAQFFL